MDVETKKLLQQGLLEIPSEDFTDQVMKHVHTSFKKKSSIKRDVKLSWLFMGLSIVFLPIGLIILSDMIQYFQHYLIKIIPIDFNQLSLFLIPVLMMTILSLLQLDNLLRLTYIHKKDQPYAKPLVGSTVPFTCETSKTGSSGRLFP